MLTYYTRVDILDTMKRILSKFSRFVRKVKAYFPSRLPVGMTEFDAWAADIIDLYGAPDNDSVRFAIATMVLHCPAQDAYKPKHYFGLTVSKSMSNQVAAAIVQELKAKQEAAIKEAARLAAEEAASNVTKISSN